jgi:hypothetical protein
MNQLSNATWESVVDSLWSSSSLLSNEDPRCKIDWALCGVEICPELFPDLRAEEPQAAAIWKSVLTYELRDDLEISDPRIKRRAGADSPPYEALGNSMAALVRWMEERIT